MNIGNKIFAYNCRYGTGKSNQLSIQLLRIILKDRRAQVQQRQVQKILEFIEQLCPWFSEYRTLDAATRKEIQ